MKFEVCTDSIAGAHLAAESGADRIELCSGLSVGGLTPSFGLAKGCSEIIETHAMIRYREGDFSYSSAEIELMVRDIQELAKSGIRGVVFGCLSKALDLDIEGTKRLLNAAKEANLEATFHRAFDFCTSPIEALHHLIDLKFDRILTSGQAQKAIEGKDVIEKLVAEAKGNIQIMAGSGVNESNALELGALGIDALHFTSHRSKEAGLGMGTSNFPDESKVKSIISHFR